MSFADILKVLTVRGFIDDETRDAVRVARAKRNALVHDAKEPMPTTAEVESLLSLARGLERELLPAVAKEAAE